MKKVIGMDLGDKNHVVIVMDENGEEIEVGRITNTSRQVQKYFEGHKGAVVAVARKLAVLLHRLWADQSEYVAVRQPKREAA